METAFDLEGSFPCGRVGEWLKPADCKSAAPCGLRRFESFPVHQAPAVGLAETAGQSLAAMFESGPIRGESTAQEKCAAKGSLSPQEKIGASVRRRRNAFGLGSSVGRARPW